MYYVVYTVNPTYKYIPRLLAGPPSKFTSNPSSILDHFCRPIVAII